MEMLSSADEPPSPPRRSLDQHCPDHRLHRCLQAGSGDGGFDYIDVSPFYVDRKRAKTNLDGWLDMAKEHPARYRDTEFIIAEVRGNA